MDWHNIQTALEGEPGFRLKQVKKALFVDLIDDWDKVTVLPKKLREELAISCPLDIPAQVFHSKDEATVKVLLTLSDGVQIESVLMRHSTGRNTVCVSTLVGCPMGCTFCATATMGLVRKLTSSEIIAQVLFFSRLLSKENERVGSIVFMGMGEPFLNYDVVMDTVRILNDPEMFSIGARHISISTCGILEGIQKLAEESLPVNLAISLHGSNDEVRKQLMPIARTYTLKELMTVIDGYIEKTHRKVMFEYLLVEGINDKDEHAIELAHLLKGKLCMVNLISYNETGKYTATTEQGVERFKKLLRKNGIEVSIRFRFGRDIEGACGQLATKSSK